MSGVTGVPSAGRAARSGGVCRARDAQARAKRNIQTSTQTQNYFTNSRKLLHKLTNITTQTYIMNLLHTLENHYTNSSENHYTSSKITTQNHNFEWCGRCSWRWARCPKRWSVPSARCSSSREAKITPQTHDKLEIHYTNKKKQKITTQTQKLPHKLTKITARTQF